MRQVAGRDRYHGCHGQTSTQPANVPEDEADEVRAWLKDNSLAFYETQPSPWGISGGGIWIEDDEQITRAKALMAEYQAQRAQQARQARGDALRDGRAETFASLLQSRPLYVLGVLAAIIGIVVLTLALPHLFLR